jgi:hypothetical protein
VNKWRAFVAGQVADRPTSTPPREDGLVSKGRSRAWSKGRSRAWGKNDARAKQKRIAKRRAKKGYK